MFSWGCVQVNRCGICGQECQEPKDLTYRILPSCELVHPAPVLYHCANCAEKADFAVVHELDLLHRYPITPKISGVKIMRSSGAIEQGWHTLGALVFKDNELKIWVMDNNDRVQKWVLLKDFIQWNPRAPMLSVTHIANRDDEDVGEMVRKCYES